MDRPWPAGRGPRSPENCTAGLQEFAAPARPCVVLNRNANILACRCKSPDRPAPVPSAWLQIRLGIAVGHIQLCMPQPTSNDGDVHTCGDEVGRRASTFDIYHFRYIVRSQLPKPVDHVRRDCLNQQGSRWRPCWFQRFTSRFSSRRARRRVEPRIARFSITVKKNDCRARPARANENIGSGGAGPSLSFKMSKAVKVASTVLLG